MVIDVGKAKLAIVGLDLVRSPRDDMMERIRTKIKQEAEIDFVLLAGSYTHHGPVIELLNEPDKGKGKFDDAVAFTVEIEQKVTHAIVAAGKAVHEDRIGSATKHVNMNRN